MTARCHGSPRASSRRSRTAGAGRDGKEHQGRGGPLAPRKLLQAAVGAAFLRDEGRQFH